MYPSYLSRYNNIIDDSSPVEIELSMIMGEGGALSLETTVEVTEAITTTNNKIIVVATNKYSTEYFATVAFYEDDQFPLTAVGETQTYTTSLDLSAFQLDDIGIGVIIQTMDDNTAVLGARYYPVNDLMDPVAQETMYFGDVEVGQTAVLPITITNYWDTPLTGQFISSSEFPIQDSFEVPAFQSMDFDMSFVPVEVSDYHTALIVIMNNATFPNDIINIYGTGIATGANEDEVPVHATLLGNYPNPFNPNTTISYNLTADEATNAELRIFDVKGKEIKTFSNLAIGENSKMEWNGTDNSGNNCPSGVYFYQLSNVKASVYKKMVLMK